MLFPFTKKTQNLQRCQDNHLFLYQSACHHSRSTTWHLISLDTTGAEPQISVIGTLALFYKAPALAFLFCFF